nr:uncharacterized protein LOC121502930 [Drosophila kikkawai]
MGVTWISYRKKMELETILGEFGLDRSGTVDKQRARLIAFSRQPNNSEEIQDRLDELERRFGNAPTGDVKSPIPLDPSLISPEPTTSASLVPPSLLLPRTLVVLLAGRAESWFRTSGLQQASWIEVRREFLDFFLPPRYYQRLEDDIRMHFQKPNEPFKEYLIDIRLQMRRAGFSSDRELERIYENMLPEYQLYTRRQDFRTLSELTHLVTNYEETRSRGGRALENRIPTQRQATGASYAADGDRMPTRRTQQAPSSGNALNGSLSRNACTSQSAVAPRPEAVNVRDACRNCGQSGHFEAECRNPRILFCWDCGQRGRRTVDCCRQPPSGNGQGPRVTGNHPRNPPHPQKPIGDTLHQYQGRIRATIHMEGQRFTATLDTGATHSFISEGLAQMLDNGRNTRDIRTQVKLADGTCRELTRALAANIYLGSERTPTILLVMSDALDDILLGMDFLSIDDSPRRATLYPSKAAKGAMLQSRRPAKHLTSSTVSRHNTTSDGEPAAQLETGFARGRCHSRATESLPYLPQKRVRFQDHVEETPEPSPPLCGTVNSVSHPTEDQVSFQTEEPETQDYPRALGEGEHRIFMRTDRPLKQRYFPRNPAMRAVIDKQINELLRDGRIEPSKSPHSAPIVIAAKKNGEVRMCVDYRQLNENSVPDAYPLPRIHQILERLRNAKFISTLDLKNGYWQIPVAPDSRECTAFTVPGRGLFHWRVMPFGLHSAPATFQRALDTVIGPDMEPHAFAYLDDIIVIGSTLEEHVANLGEVFRRLRRANLRLNRGKCHFFQRRIVYLGHVISEAGIHTDPDKVAAIRGTRTADKPEGATQMPGNRFLVSPLQKFVLQTDASDYGIGAVLTQTIDGNERVIAYASRRLNTAERNYSVTEKEPPPLKWLNSIDNPTGRIARWALELQQYQYDVHYRKGAQNLVADALSRQPLPIVQQAEVQGVNCKWITRMLQRIRTEPAKFPDYREENGQLYRRLGLRPEEEEYTPWKLCVGADYRQRVLEECHDHPTAGHLGVRKTSTRVAQRY